MKTWFARWRSQREINKELQSHLAQLTQQYIAQGLSHEEAKLRAGREFGSLDLAQEQCRDTLPLRWADHLWRDIRFGARMLAKNPGFTIVAVIALALGIGGDTAMYTVVNGALTWDLGLDRPSKTIAVQSTNPSRSRGWGVSYPDFRDFRSQVKSLTGLAAYDMIPVNLSDGSGLPERYFCVEMSANGFSVVRQKPLLGRDFVPADERLGAPPVMMIGYHIWRDRYGLDPNIIGKTVRVDEIPRAVIGVMPPGRRFPEETDIWTPLVPDAGLEKRDNRGLMLFGELRDHETLASARAELTALSQSLAAEYPDTDKDITVDVRPIIQITGLYLMKSIILALFGAVGFVLLIACADVANMLLARAADRSREISIRVALGAGKISVIRQLLLESVMLSVSGGILGCFVAIGGLRWLDRGTSITVRPVWFHLSLDTNALFYLAIISVATGILFGLAPALRLAKSDVNSTLKEGSGYGAVGSRVGFHLSDLLVSAQTALCVVLLAGAGSLIRSAINLYSAPIGVNTANVLTMRVNLPEKKYASPGNWIQFYGDLRKRLTALPGVELATVASNLPLGGWVSFPVEFQGKTNDSRQLPEIGALIVGNNYFQTLQVGARAGHLFTDSDGTSGPPVVVVNESFAAKFWPNEDALGKRLRLVEDSPGPWLTVVGIVPDILQNFRSNLEHDPALYVPFGEKPERQVYVVARTAVLSATLTSAFRREVQRADANLAAYDIRTLDQRIAENRLGPALFSSMWSIFAAVATILAAIGLYAVVAHAVSQRTREIGLRIALGATRRDIARLVFAQAIRPLAPGLIIGFLLALAAGRILPFVLVGVSSSDPLTFTAILAVLISAAALGCLLPARRATRVDPVSALRCG